MMAGPRVAPRVHQYPNRNLPKVRPNGQFRKIQDHDLPTRGNLHMDVRGDLQSEEQRGWGHLPGAPLMAHPMSGLWDGVDIQIHDSQSHTIAWSGDGDRLGPTTSQSDVTPPDII